MKKKILSLLAAFFMLFGTSAMAQVDSTLEGDVNGDGVVDIADITAVIAIIKQNAEANPTYYWYVGNKSPEGMTPPSIGNANSTLCQWTSLGASLPTNEIKVYKGDEINYDDHTWYVAAPYDSNYVLYNGTGVASNEAAFNISNAIIGGIKYKIWTSKGVSDQVVGYLKR